MHRLRHLIQRRNTVSAPPGATVFEVATLMTAAGVGAIPILEGERLVGIFTERDLMGRVVVPRRDPERTRVAEVWTREELPVRDRRLVLLGIIGALGERDTFQIQVKAALKNGELTPAQVREVVITLASYAGYPRAAAQVVATEQTIAAVEKEKKAK